ncbi:sigma-70 family RNA polymerase sigma factor [Desulfococcaceae bacterium HSG8]|nr:sigma-70 family RNA polymerase sigma factor [Desulfococcaceae bacterium HSG8]
MLKNKVESDIRTAKKICEELHSGNKEAITDLYYKYHRFFMNFARHSLYDTDSVEDVLSDFWLELLNTKAICAYEGKKNASLRTYLSKILKWRIIDNNRKKRIIMVSDPPPELTESDSLSSSLDDAPKIRQNKLTHDALLQLEKISPRDAKLMRMRLKGMTYKEMAELELAGKMSDQKTIERKTDAIRKQLKRPRTGSIAKFTLIIERLRRKYGWNHIDLFN